jgi:hypothetical protein
VKFTSSGAGCRTGLEVNRNVTLDEPTLEREISPEDTPSSVSLTIELIARLEIQLLRACNNRLVSRNCLFCA